jgi:predicted RecB family nuclease
VVFTPCPKTNLNDAPLITAAILYNFVECPHRVALDAFSDQSKRDPVSPFVRMLWERGNLYEAEVIGALPLTTEYCDLSAFRGDELEAKTLEAIAGKAQLIYGGRLRVDDLVGEPDLLRLEPGGYVPGDIKSGRAEEGGDDESEGKPKLTYAVQLALYIDILERLGLSAGRRGFIWDARGEEVVYRFDEPQGQRKPETLWDEYQHALTQTTAVLSRQTETRGAYAASCKLCHWYTVCGKELESADDLTLIPFLGRTKRDALLGSIPTISDMAEIDPSAFFNGKKTIFSGIGQKTLQTFNARAQLLKAIPAEAYLTDVVALPTAEKELFFDIEDNPMRGICYLHGIVERSGGDASTERFIGFFADEPTAEAEERAFAEAWAYFQANPTAVMYYYSPYERTTYRKLQRRYPSVCSADDIEALFSAGRAVDLYTDVVRGKTEWPTRDYSIKTLAKHLGFSWRDTDPSGAASIEWYEQWLKTKDARVKERILAYNEDDCRATRVLLDGIRGLRA